MLFNSYEFIFFFLPATLALFFLLGRLQSRQWAIGSLVFCSLFFYGWWNPAYLSLILFSIVFNYSFGSILTHEKPIPLIGRRGFLAIGVAVNLGLIGYFKYANFFVDTVNALANTNFQIGSIVLPLAISFFTFQQISYLVDAYQGETKEYNFLRYCLFVCFFPQLIAGPIVLHKEVMPQFARKTIYQMKGENLAIGLTIFSIGLFKKVIIADSVALYATPVFQTALDGTQLTFFESWCGTLAYTMQLYFDFSGYSDMAIGAARMFGIVLPLNFNSPYKSINIADFWRRWHMTLSRFLRDYLYIPLGGNRKGQRRRYVNLMITMLLGGLWHGAGWTFVFWGGLHGGYLVVHRQWQQLRQKWGHNLQESTWWGRWLAWGLTFLAVMVAWVFFRAESMSAAGNMLYAMFGGHGISLPRSLSGVLGFLPESVFPFEGVRGTTELPSVAAILWIAVASAIALFAPNTQQLLEHYYPALNHEPTDPKTKGISPQIRWHPNLFWSIFAGVAAALSIVFILRPSEFLYFQF
jgi:D-alanyl-lipoteichoic acid acyltransferase DltB (MBOAT superfamily)